MLRRQRYLFLLVLFAAQPAVAAELAGKVVGVTDGDTLTLLVQKEQHKIRLEGIDAPERRQDYGTQAKQHLSKLVFGKRVTAQVIDKDRYGRLVADILIEGQSVNRQMVLDGYAWRYPKYDEDGTYTRPQQKARQAGRGLWADNDPVPPWQWRRQRRK